MAVPVTVAVDLEEVRLLDLIAALPQLQHGTSEYDNAISELIRWMRPRALTFLSRRIPRDQRAQQSLRDNMDGFLWEFVTGPHLSAYLTYRARAQAIGGELIGLRRYLFGGRRTTFFRFFRSQLSEGVFGAALQRGEKVREAMRKALYRMRRDNELTDYIRSVGGADIEEWIRTETLDLTRDAELRDVRVLRSDHAASIAEIRITHAERAREERLIELSRRGTHSGSWRKFVLRTFDRFEYPLLMTTFIQSAVAMTAELGADADGTADSQSADGE